MKKSRFSESQIIGILKESNLVPWSTRRAGSTASAMLMLLTESSDPGASRDGQPRGPTHRGRHQPTCCAGNPGLERIGGTVWCAAADRPDYGPEFVAHVLTKWAESKHLALNQTNPASPRRMLMSNDSTRPTAPRCWTATSSSHCRRYAT